MKTKKQKRMRLLNLFFVLISFIGFSQQRITHECGTDMHGKPKIFTKTQLQVARQAMLNPANHYVFKLRVNYVQDAVPDAEKEAKALDIVGALNLYYNSANIFFKYGGYVTHNNLVVDYVNGSGFVNQFAYEAVTNTAFVDIFIVNSINYNPSNPNGIVTGLAVVGHDTVTGLFSSSKFVLLDNDFIPVFNSQTPSKANTIVHEMAHYFGIYHTFQKRYYDNGVLKIASQSCSINNIKENLNGTEWATMGDLVQDTPPDRRLSEYGLQTNGSCVITGNTSNPTSNCGNEAPETLNLSTFTPALNNIMQYNYSITPTTFDCRNQFTIGQKEW